MLTETKYMQQGRYDDENVSFARTDRGQTRQLIRRVEREIENNSSIDCEAQIEQA